MKHSNPLPSRPLLLLSLLVGAALTTGCGSGGGGGQNQGGGGQNQTEAVWDQFDWDDANWR